MKKILLLALMLPLYGYSQWITNGESGLSVRTKLNTIPDSLAAKLGIAHGTKTATTSELGNVKIGSGVSVANDGTISVATVTLPATYTPSTITVAGDVTGSGGNQITLTLANIVSAISGANSITVNAKGQVTSATTVEATPSQWTTNGSNIYYNTGSVGIGTMTPTTQLELTGNLTLPNTTTSTVGVIMKGASRFIHDFYTTGTTGRNLFVGENAGNFTAGIGQTGGYGSNNVGVGYNALTDLTTGYANVVVGSGSLKSVTTGFNNIAIGYNALPSVTTRTSNIAVGGATGYSVTNGYNNTFIGHTAGYRITTGYNNVFLGEEAGHNASQLATGSNMMALGVGAYTTESNQFVYGDGNVLKHMFGSGQIFLKGVKILDYPLSGSLIVGDGGASISHTTGSTGYYNTMIGVGTGNAIALGYHNTALGYQSLYSMQDAGTNVAIGYKNMYANTTGYDNVSVGGSALYSNTTGLRNVALGKEAMYLNLDGGNNMALGYQSLYNCKGSENVAMGYQSGYSITTGSGGVFVGSSAGSNASQSATGTNMMALGYQAYSDESNKFVYGNSSVAKHVFTAGNVGVGVANPKEKMTINGTFQFLGGTETTNSIIGTIGSRVRAADNSPASFANIIFQTAGTDWYKGCIVFATASIDGTNPSYPPEERMRVNYDGKIGIGTKTPTTNLDVVGDVYVSGNVSALTFTDRTPFYEGDALKELSKVSGKNGHIDHSTLPSFAHRKEKWEDKTVNGKTEKVKVSEEGRDLGAMISILTKAIQQLTAKTDSLQNELNQLKNK